MDMLTLSQEAPLLREALRAADAAGAPGALAAKLGRNEAELSRALNAWAGLGAEPGPAPAEAPALPWERLLAPDLGPWLLRERPARLKGEVESSPAVPEAAQPAFARSGVARSGGLRLPWTAHLPQEVAGLQVHLGWFDGPFGRMAVTGATEGPALGLSGLAFAGDGGPQGREAALADLRDRWPGAGFLAQPEPLAAWVAALLAGRGEVPLLLIGSALELAVWQVLLEIPSGQVASYSQLAARVGRPRAVRAVASAVGRNPLSWLVPCHRALRKSGALGGYYWGLPMKRALLAREAARYGHEPPAS